MANRYVLDLIINAKDNASGALDSVGKGLGGVGKMATGLAVVGTALAATGAAAFSTANQIDEAGDQMAAALDLPQEEARAFEETLRGVYRGNFGSGFDDIAESIVQVESNLRRLSDRSQTDLQSMTEDALALRDVYGEGVNETTSAAATLMENFGLSSDEAMDFITAGFQRGLNASGDFLDSIGEYAVQFKDGGANAGQFFSIMESGMQGGMLGTDKAADLFKEFRVRIQDGSKTTSEALTALGIDSEQMGQAMADGSMTAIAAFRQVLRQLEETDDANLRMQAGVGLLGTQFEDLGQSAVLGLDAIGYEMEAFEGATDSLGQKYDNLGSALEGFKRRGLLALEPLGEALLGVANDALPHLETFFSWIEEHGPGAIEAVTGAFSDGLAWLEERLGGSNETVQAILEKAAIFWDQHGEGILEVLGNLAEMGEVLFDQFVGNILDIVDLGLSILTGDWEGAADALESIWERTRESAERIFRLALDSVLTLVDGFVPGFKDRGRSVIDGLLGGLQEAWQGVVSWFGNLSWPSLPSLPSLPSFGLPGFATGTNYAPGGMAWVGERGPEIVNLPRGSQVYSAGRSAAMASATNNNSWNVTINVTGGDAQATARAVERGVLSAKRRMGL